MAPRVAGMSGVHSEGKNGIGRGRDRQRQINMSDIKFFKRGSLTSAQAWGQLKHKYGDESCYNEKSGEVWHYMSSVVKDNDEMVEHQFRHRSLPSKNEEREYFSAYTKFTRNDYQ